MSGVSMRTSVITPMVGINVSIILFTFISSDLLHNFNDVHRDRALCKASAAADAAEKTVVVFGVVNKLVHKSLAETLLLGETVVSVSHSGELGIHAGVPASVTDNSVSCVEILYVIALACGANEGAGSAAKAGRRKLIPCGIVKELTCFAAAESLGGKLLKGKLIHDLGDLFLLLVNCLFAGLLKKSAKAEYNAEIEETIKRIASEEIAQGKKAGGGDNADDLAVDAKMEEAIQFIIESGQASTSMLQRRLKVGYARAGRMIDDMEQLGIVGPHQGSKPRDVLMTYNEWLERRNVLQNSQES